MVHALLHVLQGRVELSERGLREIEDNLVYLVQLLLTFLQGDFEVTDFFLHLLTFGGVFLSGLYQLLIDVLQSGELVSHSLYGCFWLLCVDSDDYFSIHVGMILF